MGACDGLRRLEPVAPAVGDRPSIGDEGHPRQSERHGPSREAGGEYRATSVTPLLRSILPDPLRLHQNQQRLAIERPRTVTTSCYQNGVR